MPSRTLRAKQNANKKPQTQNKNRVVFAHQHSRSLKFVIFLEMLLDYTETHNLTVGV